LGLDL
jgi:hypothetical protein